MEIILWNSRAALFFVAWLEPCDKFMNIYEILLCKMNSSDWLRSSTNIVLEFWVSFQKKNNNNNKNKNFEKNLEPNKIKNLQIKYLTVSSLQK